jgi:hypothetical protein
MATDYTGRLVTPNNLAVPHPVGVAVALGRMPRYTGSTKVPWQVLHHLRVSMELSEMPPFRRQIHQDQQLLTLLCATHDGEESMGADVRTTWKCNEHRALLSGLEGRIDRAYVGHLHHWRTDTQTLEEIRADVKRIDLLALRAEMYTVAPPNELENSGLRLDDSPQLTRRAVEVTERVLSEFGDPRTFMYEQGDLVQWYLIRLRELMGQSAWERVAYETPHHPIIRPWEE